MLLIKVNLKRIMENRGMSYSELHQLTGIRQATIYDIINNKRRSVRLDYLYKIMRALNVLDIHHALTVEE